MIRKLPHCRTCGQRATGVFCSLTTTQLSKLDIEKTIHEYQRSQIVFYEGNPPVGVYCIYSGLVKLYKTGRKGKQQVIRILGPGEIMGYRALLAKEPCSCTAEAIETSTICIIPKTTLLHLLQQSTDLSFQFLEKLGHELGIAEDQMMQLTQESVRQRTARLIVLLFEGSGKKLGPNKQIKVPFLRREMAEMIGASPETLTRTLHHFTQSGLIIVKGSEIYVNNLSTLQRIAYGAQYQT